MRITFILVYIISLLYSCTPINKQHGYLLEDMITSVDKVSQFNEGTTTENDIFINLGSPSIQIDDINNVWIYLISIKEKNVFEKDDIIFQSIMRFEFDSNGVLLSKNLTEADDFNEISFVKEKTKAASDSYGIAEQLYESFTRGL